MKFISFGDSIYIIYEKEILSGDIYKFEVDRKELYAINSVTLSD